MGKVYLIKVETFEKWFRRSSKIFFASRCYTNNYE